MPHYLLQQPRRLDRMAVVKLARWIKLLTYKLAWPLSCLYYSDKIKAEVMLNQQIEIVRNLLGCNVPRTYYNDLLDETARLLGKLYSKWITCCESPITTLERKNVAIRMIETLFNNNLNSLNICGNNMKLFCHVFYARSHILSGLTQLKLDSSENVTINVEFLKELHNLKYLCYNGKCVDDVLMTVADNCSFIEELNLYNSDLNDSHIEILIQMPNLKKMDLSKTTVTEIGIERILMCCDYVEFIDFDVETNIVALALESILLKDTSNKMLKLKSFATLADISKEHLQSIIRMCPQLQKVCLKKHHTFNDYFVILKDFSNLHEIELSGNITEDIPNIREINVKLFNLADLRFTHVSNLNSDLIINLLRCVPNLQTLSLSQCNFVEETMSLNNVVLLTNNLLNLKRITLQETRLAQDQFIYLLWHCRNIEFISIGTSCDSIKLTDDIMLKIFDKNSLVYLKELDMYHSALSFFIIDRIIENSINTPSIYCNVSYGHKYTIQEPRPLSHLSRRLQKLLLSGGL